MKILVALKYGVVPLPIEITRLSDKDRHDLEDNLNLAYKLFLQQQVSDQLPEDEFIVKVVDKLNGACLKYINKKNDTSLILVKDFKPGLTD